MTDSVPVQTLDIDELANEKVQEIEKLLASGENIKLDIINSWLSVLKQMITAADLHRTNDKNNKHEEYEKKIEVDDSIYADYADDYEQFNAIDLTEQFATNSVKWTIRVKAFKLVHRLVQILSRSTQSKTPLLKHLSDLVRLSFVAATSPYDDLKIQGFEMFKYIINRFANTEEKEFPGQSILDQYRTQVLSALKPAFNLDAPPYITAIATQVCCLWICRGLEKEPNNLERTYQLMLATIDKLEYQSVNHNSKLYTESELEQERLDILGSWAQLYIIAEDSNSQNLSITSNSSKSNLSHLSELVKPQVKCLINKWWEALKDYALLIMPAPRITSSTHDNEHVYTREVALRLFAPVWPKIILASTIWLCSQEESNIPNQVCTQDELSMSPLNNNCTKEICDDESHNNQYRTNRVKYFNFICGILMKEFCDCLSETELEKESLSESTILAIRSLSNLVNNDNLKVAFLKEIEVAHEFYTILYSILIKRTKTKSYHHQLVKNLFNSISNLMLSKSIDNLNGPSILDHIVIVIKRDLKKVEDASRNSETNEIELNQTNISLRTGSIVAIIKLLPELLIDHPHTRSAIIETFQSILSLQKDSSLNVNLREQLKGFRDALPEKLLDFFKFDIKNLDDESQNLKTGNNVKRETQSERKQAVSVENVGKAKAKITLKTDFSNFYAKKS